MYQTRKARPVYLAGFSQIAAPESETPLADRALLDALDQENSAPRTLKLDKEPFYENQSTVPKHPQLLPLPNG